MRKVLRVTVAVLLLGGCVAGTDERPGVAELALTERWRIGAVDEEGRAFTYVRGILPQDSSVLVLEVLPPRVGVFHRTGRWLGDIGGAGDGPGEFRRPSLLGRTKDRIWVGDPMGGRLEVFFPTGAPAQSFRWDVPPDTLGSLAFPMALLEDGTVLAGPGSLAVGAALMKVVTHRRYVRASDTGEVLGTIYDQSLSTSDFMQASFADGTAMVGTHPLKASPAVAVYPDGSGVVVVERPEPEGPGEASYRLMIMDPTGKVEVDRSVPFTPVRAEEMLERLLEAQSQGATEPGRTAAIREAFHARQYHPPVSEVVAGGDGSVWIRREAARPDSVVWEVFGRNGRAIGRLVAPLMLQILWASRGEVWGVLPDALDVPFVVGFEVSTAGAP